LSAPVIHESKDGDLPEIVSTNKSQGPTLWQKIRSGVMFGVACIASPCCTPIIVPIGIALLAGTPAAIWLSANIGWVYGGLTLLSIVSLVLGFRWLRQKSSPRHSTGARSKAGQQHIQEVTH
jgi:membrane protein implicated in regulation of membrane protease activity